MSEKKPLLVGEANPYNGDSRYALFPFPDRSAGHLLCTRVMALSRSDYLRRFDRVNLCGQKWSMREARARTRDIVVQYDKVVLFGSKVSTAFGYDFAPFTKRAEAVGGCSVVILPHPSGLNRMWNEPGACERARAILREAGVL